MGFLRHEEIYRSDEEARSGGWAAPGAHRFDEFPAGYSLAGCSPAEPASASPAGYSIGEKAGVGNLFPANGNLSPFTLSHDRGAAQGLCVQDGRKRVAEWVAVGLCRPRLRVGHSQGGFNVRGRRVEHPEVSKSVCAVHTVEDFDQELHVVRVEKEKLSCVGQFVIVAEVGASDEVVSGIAKNQGRRVYVVHGYVPAGNRAGRYCPGIGNGCDAPGGVVPCRGVRSCLGIDDCRIPPNRKLGTPVECTAVQIACRPGGSQRFPVVLPVG